MAGICGSGSPETRLGCMSASARPCDHSWHRRLPPIPTALSWSTTGATTRLNLGTRPAGVRAGTALTGPPDSGMRDRAESHEWYRSRRLTLPVSSRRSAVAT